MQWNKKSASLLAALSLLLGSAGAIGLQVHAQQSSVPTQPAQIQTQSTTPAVSEQENSALEQNKEKKGGIEAEANENLPGGGHQDQNGTNIDHQFEGME